MIKKKTSWGHVSGWYDKLIERGEDTYQKKVILPNLLRLMDVKRGETVLDLACGQGFFSRELSKLGAHVIGADISKELITLARTHSPKGIQFEVSPADNLSFLKNNSIDIIVMVLAIQNIENIDGVLKECGRVLKQNGRFFIAMNHPAFRIPKESSWGWDQKLNLPAARLPNEHGQATRLSAVSAQADGSAAQVGMQYRRVDRYLSEVTSKIVMNPGARTSVHTISFHRSLQFYFKKFFKNGFAVTRLEEWISHRKSEKGPRAIAEDHARKEIPLFLCLEIKKL
ncbi:MAG: class I SAM-dependent methyltransferase [bacterium]|nr:class I SAM-dependent methyltransferase [bacterium]